MPLFDKFRPDRKSSLHLHNGIRWSDQKSAQWVLSEIIAKSKLADEKPVKRAKKAFVKI